MKFNELKRDLEWRGLLKDVTNQEVFEKIVENGDAFYIGIDPTADSIHVGHYMSLSLIRILAKHGLRPVVILGGFTGMIGDPSGRNSEREVVDREVIKANVVKITEQVKRLTSNLGIENVEVIDNTTFYEEMSIIDIYQIYGKLFNVNTMLSRDSVKTRLEAGISYTEFSYQMFQSIDFLKLYEKHGVKLQLGGSDQWGNIVAGTELIRKMHGSEVEVCGLTINLLTDENGNKIGKTQGVPMWLDINKTSAYVLFQYFINQSDETAKKLLAQTTSINEEEYFEVIAASNEDPRARVVQNELAKRFISSVHNESDFVNAQSLSKLLFEERYDEINLDQIEALKSLPSVQSREIPLMDLMVEEGKIASRREYRDFLKNGSVKINGKSIDDENLVLGDEFLKGKIAFVNLGKKNKYLVWK